MNKEEKIKQLEEQIKKGKRDGISLTLLNSAKRVLNRLKGDSVEDEEINSAMSLVKALREIKKSRGVINDPETLLRFSKILKPKEYISMHQLRINRDEDSMALCGSIELNSSPVGRAYRGATLEDGIVVPMGNAGFTEITKLDFAPFSTQFITVNFKSKLDLKKAQDDGFWVIEAGRKTRAFMYNSTRKVWEDIVNGESFSFETLQSIAVLTSGTMRLYKCFIYSPSDVRTFSYAAIDVTNGDCRDEYLNKISNGAWNMSKKALQKLKESGASDDKINLFILKTMPRFGQLKAGSLNLGEIVSWAFYQGVFETFSGETVDGTGYFRASFIAHVLTILLGITITEEAVCGLFIQARPDMQKAAYYVIDDESFDIMMEAQSEAGLIEVYGSKKDTVKPVLLVDQNVVKLPSEWEINDICLELLEVAEFSPAHMSKQAFEKPLVVKTEETQDYSYGRGSTQIKKMFDTALVGKAKIPTPGEVAKSYLANTVAAIAPKKILQVPALTASILKNTVQSAVNTIEKLKIAVDGGNVKLISDFSELIAGKGRENAVVQYGEIWSPNAEKFFVHKYRMEAREMYKDMDDHKEHIKAVNLYIDAKMQSTLVCMIKYPSMGVGEYYLARPLRLREIKGRINKMNISSKKKDALKRMFGYMTEGVTMLPALKIVMFQCAGLDYDFDGATLIYDQDYCMLLAGQKQVVVNIKE